MDDKDLFSYDNSGNLEETGEESFDLNSFSSHIEKEPVKGKKGRKKRKSPDAGEICSEIWLHS